MNLKFHIVLSGVFLLLIFGTLVLFEMNTPVAEQPKSIVGDRFVQIKSATWGENCNPFILSAQQQLQEKNETENMPKEVRKDNALRTVSSLCNGRTSCSFSVSPDSLRFQPIKNCDKEFELEYRCFITDMAHKIKAEDGETVSIDCRDTSE